ncbi:MAG: aminotransferase class V-fold PLP-dependent enzyme [Pseudomonadota bacterium]
MMVTRRRLIEGGFLAGAAIASGCFSSQNASQEAPFWTQVREAFPTRSGTISLLHTGGGATPTATLEQLASYQDAMASGRGYSDPVLASLKESGSSEALRIRMAKAFGCEKDEIALTRNAMEGLAIGLLGIDLEPGDEVLTTDADYDSCIKILQQRAARDSIRVKIIDIPMPSSRDEDVVDAFEAACTDRTKLILLCHMYNKNGQILPIRKVCDMARRKGITTLVDGAQSIGHFDFRISDLNCDMFAASLHKWFYAPRGTGVFYVRRDRIESIWPIWASWSGKPADSIEKFEDFGTVSKAVSASLASVFEFNDRIGAARKENRLRELRDLWIEPLLQTGRVSLLTDLSPSRSCGITAFKVDGIEADYLANLMRHEHNIDIGSIHLQDKPEFVGNYLAADLTNSPTDFDRFLDAFSTIAT